MSITYNLASGSFPVPIAPVAPVIGGGTSGPFSTGMTVGTSHLLNQLSAIAILFGQVGGGGYGVVTGCDVSSPSGLNVAMSNGIALLDGPTEFIASGAFGSQKNVPFPYTLADNATSYLWLTDAGALVAATTLVPPTGARLFLATVTTLAGVVTGIDYSGRLSLVGALFRRTTADLWAPSDTPPAIALLTQTASGAYLWDGSSHKLLSDLTRHVPKPWEKLTLAADLTLTADSPNVIAFDCGGASRNIALPDPTLCSPGHGFLLQNVGAAGTGTVRNHAGTNLGTVSPANQVAVGPYYSSGVLVWPSSVTPVALGGPL